MSRELVDSYVEWIGKYPNEWMLFPLRAVVENINEKNNPIKFTNVLSLTNKLGVVPYEEKGNQGNISKEDISQYKIAYKDTVIINSMNLKIGSVGYSKYDGCVSPVYYILKNNEKSDIRFINYIFQSNFQKYLSKYGKGIMEIREKISMYDVLHSYVPIPSLREQKRIVDYLNKQCKAIENIIDDNNQEIKLLNEYKENLITENVNKVEFRKVKLKNVCIKITDGAHISPDTNNGIYDFVSVVDLQENGKIDFEHCLKTSLNSYEQMVRNSCNPIKGDVLISKDGSVGKTALIDYDKNFVVASSIVILRPNQRLINSKYLEYSLNSHIVKETLKSYLTGAGLKRVSIEKNKNLIIRIPNIKEQKKIIDFLDRKCLKLDQIISYRMQIIEKLEEYKKSLIYEAVTGKIEV